MTSASTSASTSAPAPPSLSTLLHTLDTFIRDLQDQGIRTVPCAGPLPFVDSAAPPPPAAAPVARTPAAAPPAPQPPPPAPAAATPTKASSPELVMLRLERLPECPEHHAPEHTTLLLVLEARELHEPEHRNLLQSMLHAIGYPLPDHSEPVADITDCTDKACRILCMGEKANELFCTLNMGLNLVRGKWQATPAGRMIATYAPSYLVNNAAGKRAAWNDLQKLLQDLGLSVPEWTRKKLAK